ncbi:Hypothetical protein I5071_69200 [Sandaracinus amylolyticus]|nr:Hypothetical protein I5071_69200 [Sandaracinus amylolyticus]
MLALAACGSEGAPDETPPDFETMTPAELCEIYEGFGDAPACEATVELEHLQYPLCRALYTEMLYWDAMRDRAIATGEPEARYGTSYRDAYTARLECLDRHYPLD